MRCWVHRRRHRLRQAGLWRRVAIQLLNVQRLLLILLIHQELLMHCDDVSFCVKGGEMCQIFLPECIDMCVGLFLLLVQGSAASR